MRWDLLDRLWSYMLNLVSDAESQGSSETYFQDQPVLMKLEFLSERIACFSVGSRKHILPREEFLRELAC